MKPIMTAVGMFVDSIIKTATMTIVTGYDENGKPIYERIDPDEFNNAGDVIVTQFSNFVEKLGDNFSRMKPSTVEAIEDLDDNMVPIMNSVSAFVDSIMKLATGVYIMGKANDGSEIYGKVTPDDFKNAADVIVDSFMTFIDRLHESVKPGGFMQKSTSDYLEALEGSLGTVMESLGTFANAIVVLATGSYVDHYEKDKDGSLIPIY